MYLHEAQEIDSINPPLESNHAMPREVVSTYPTSLQSITYFTPYACI